MFGFVTPAPVAASRSAALPSVCRRQRPFTVMRADSSKKKAADLVFAQDVKGKPVWSLREAKVEDVPSLQEVGGELGRLGEETLRALVSAGEPGCIVCEASVKGTKAGEGFKGVILGGVVTDITVGVKNPEEGFSSGLVKRAELIAASVSPKMPDPDSVKKTLVLGSMKKLKFGGINKITRSVAESNSSDQEFYKSLGFDAAQAAPSDVRGSKTKQVKLSAITASINPDPKKRFS